MLHLTRNINPTQKYINDYVDLGGGLVAHRYGILTTSYVAYEVYRHTELSAHEYSSITHEPAYGWLGDITTRRLPAELDALPAWSKERSDAVGAYLDSLKEQAETLIRQTFPQDFADITIHAVCGHDYSIAAADTDANEIADLKTQMCPGCIEEMIAFEKACEAEYQSAAGIEPFDITPALMAAEAREFYHRVTGIEGGF